MLPIMSLSRGVGFLSNGALIQGCFGNQNGLTLLQSMSSPVLLVLVVTKPPPLLQTQSESLSTSQKRQQQDHQRSMQPASARVNLQIS